MLRPTKNKGANWNSSIDPQQIEALKLNASIMERTGRSGASIADIRANAEVLRNVLNKGGPKVAVQQDLFIKGPFRDIPIRLYQPDNSSLNPTLIFFHGGGFRFGNHLANDRQMREIVQRWGGAVISADYVHVPEHRFPDPVLEATAVVSEIARKGGDWGLDVEKIALGGTSAGASIAFGAYFELKERSINLVKSIVSIYGVLNDNLDSESMRTYGCGDFYLETKYLAKVYEDYLAGANADDCRAFALKGDLSELPPVFVAAAEFDPLKDDSLLFSWLLSEEGRAHILKVYPGVVHGFFGNTDQIRQARECLQDISEFLRDTLGVSVAK